MKKFLKEKLAKDLMTKEVLSVHANAPVKTIVKMFAKKGVISVPVVDQENKILGIIRAKDLDIHFEEFEPPLSVSLLGSVLYLDDLEKFQEEMQKKLGLLAADIMVSPVICMEENATLHELLECMEKNDIYRLPIVNKKNQLVGMVTNTDIIKELIKEGKNL